MESVYEQEYKFCPTCQSSLVRKEIEHKARLTCPNCGFIFWNNPKPVTSILLHKDGKVLMLKSHKEPYVDYWVLPGGYIDYEEEPFQAAAREVKEEIGLEAKIESLIDVYRIGDDPRGANIDIVYVGTAEGEPKVESETFSEFAYFSPNELPEKIAYNHRGVIQKWSKNA